MTDRLEQYAVCELMVSPRHRRRGDCQAPARRTTPAAAGTSRRPLRTEGQCSGPGRVQEVGLGKGRPGTADRRGAGTGRVAVAVARVREL